MKKTFIFVFSLLYVLVITPDVTTAHEYEPNLRWFDLYYASSYGHNVIKMKVSDNLLDNGPFENKAQLAVSNWNNHSNNYVSASMSSFSSSNVDYADYDNWPGDWAGLDGLAILYDNYGGNNIDGTFQYSTIYYAQLNLKAENFNPSNDHAERLVAHELGHAMNLGHPEDSGLISSIMLFNCPYKIPQDHDRDDLENMY